MKISRKRGIYEKYIKRLFDIICSLLAIICFSWLYIIVAVLVRIKLGSPILFKQPRPGLIDNKTGKEKIFYMYKFRTMTDKKDENGNLLPDEVRLTPFGKKLRATSLDELPEAFNILKGDMSIIGPRPALWNQGDLIAEREKYGANDVKPGLTGWAQINGRDELEIPEKAKLDGEYVKRQSFLFDLKCFIGTISSVLKHEGFVEGKSSEMMESKKQ